MANVSAALQIDPITVNFGNVDRNAPAQTKTIKIDRGDGGPIDPKIVTTGHEQIAAELREIKAGESYELTITANPPWPNGMLRGTLQLDTGVEKSPQESITVFARINPRLTAVPNRFTIPREFTQDLDLKAQLNWSDKKPGKIIAATVDNQQLSVEITEENGTQTIVLHVPADFKLGGRPRFTVSLKTDDPEAPSLTIPVYGMQARPTPVKGSTIRPTGVSAGDTTPKKDQ